MALDTAGRAFGHLDLEERGEQVGRWPAITPKLNSAGGTKVVQIA
jgi:hypothetical protein